MALNKFFRFPFATAGDKAAIPDATQPAGTVSYEEGFGPDYELDPGVDPAAKDVPRDETNQLYFDITTAIREYQTFGVPDYITAAQNGGVAYEYAKYARVKWTDGKVYISKVDNNADDPTVAASWGVDTENVDFVAINTTAFEGTVIDGEAVYWDGTQFDEALADGTAAQNFIGFADVTNGRVFVYGQVLGLFSGLTQNVEYFLSTVTPGAITSVRPAANVVSVGVARTATGLYVNPRLAIPNASQTVAGLVEQATNAEVLAGTDTSRYITPAGLRAGLSATGSAPIYAVRAWVRTSGVTGTIGASGNVSSVANPSTGRFTVNFTTALPDANYAYSFTPKCLNALGTADVIAGQHNTIAPTTALCDFLVRGITSFNGNNAEFSATFIR